MAEHGISAIECKEGKLIVSGSSKASLSKESVTLGCKGPKGVVVSEKKRGLFKAAYDWSVAFAEEELATSAWTDALEDGFVLCSGNERFGVSGPVSAKGFSSAVSVEYVTATTAGLGVFVSAQLAKCLKSASPELEFCIDGRKERISCMPSFLQRAEGFYGLIPLSALEAASSSEIGLRFVLSAGEVRLVSQELKADAFSADARTALSKASVQAASGELGFAFASNGAIRITSSAEGGEQDSQRALSAAELKTLWEKAPFTIELAKWQDSKLALVLSAGKDLGDVVSSGCAQRVVFREKDKEVAAEALPVEAPGKLLWFATIDFASICETTGVMGISSLKLYFEYAAEGGSEWVSTPSLGEKRLPEVFSVFTEGFWLGSAALALPDESKQREFVIRLVGCQASLIRAGWAGLKNRKFENRLLNYAASLGRSELFAAAEALSSGRMQTSVRVLPDNAVMCRCTSEKDRLDLDLDITNLARAKNASILDDGCTIEDLGANINHPKHFECLRSMMVEFDEICKANDIEYVLSAGTMLGAVRDHGFIPWDHDVDLFIMDTEFEKLAKVYEAGGFPANRRLDYTSYDPDLPDAFGRYMNCDTSRFNPARMRGQGGIGSAGIFIDLFILVPIAGATHEERHEHVTDFLVYEELRNRLGRKFSYRDKLFCKKLEEAYAVWDEQGFDAALAFCKKKLETLRDPDSDYVYLQSAGTISPYGMIYPKDTIFPSKDVHILDYDFPIPEKAITWLKSNYGPDWRVYPAQRNIPWERNLYNSFKVPCDLIIEGALKEVSREDLLNVRSHHKSLLSEELLMKSALFDEELRLTNLAVVEKINHALRLADKPLSEYVAEHDWKSIDKLFAEYYAIQRVPGKGHAILNPSISSEQFQAAILNLLCNKSSINFAHKLCGIRSNDPESLDDLDKQTIDFVYLVESVRDHVEFGRIAEAREAIAQVKAAWHDVVDADLYELMLDLDEECPDAAAVIERARSGYLRTGEIRYLFVMAEALIKTDKAVTAFSLYQLILRDNFDGMLLNVANDRVKEL